jgi:hypothetical protein
MVAVTPFPVTRWKSSSACTHQTMRPNDPKSTKRLIHAPIDFPPIQVEVNPVYELQNEDGQVVRPKSPIQERFEQVGARPLPMGGRNV